MLRIEGIISEDAGIRRRGDAGILDATSSPRPRVPVSLRHLSRCRNMFERVACILVVLMILATGGGAARAQALPGQMYGPPTAEQLREARMSEARKVTNAVGMPELPEGALRQPDVPLPDLTQVPPTTTDPTKLSNSLQIVILLSVLTLAPSILLMCTCFTRIIIVLSLLRQAMGVQQLPPNQVMIGLALFMTFLVMSPTWNEINKTAITRRARIGYHDVIKGFTFFTVSLQSDFGCHFLILCIQHYPRSPFCGDAKVCILFINWK